MRILGGLVLVAVVALTGCATTPQPAAQSKSQAAEKPAEKSEPAPTLEAAAPKKTDAETLYYESVLRIEGLEETPEEDAMKVGAYICDEMDAGTPPLDIETIPTAGEYANDQIVLIAAITLCTQHEDVVQQLVIDKQGSY